MLRRMRSGCNEGFDLYQRRPGKYQLIVPILHEDGDMVDIYLQDSPNGKGSIRICDFGMALMRLSYTYEINTPSRSRIFDSILKNNGIQNSNGSLFLDTTHEMLHECVLQFAGCVQKVCNMSYWSREIIRSTFYEDLREYNEINLKDFNPMPDICPLADDKLISVDWTISHQLRKFYLFGVSNNDKAKSVTISLLEFQRAELKFISLIVHENMEELGKKATHFLTKNADIQYPTLSTFQEKALADIRRLAA